MFRADYLNLIPIYFYFCQGRLFLKALPAILARPGTKAGPGMKAGPKQKPGRA
jgi:hypothetical protein